MNGTTRAAASRLVICMIAAAAALAAAAGPAAAATVTHDPLLAANVVGYAALDAEANRLTVTATATDLVFADDVVIATAPVTGDCAAGPPATCPLGGALGPVDTLAIALGDLDDTIALGPGLPATSVDGGAGNDVADYGARTDPVSAALDGTGPDRLTGVEGAAGGAAGDTLTGDGQANGLAGGAGADTLAGAGGADRLDGGDGGDTLTGGAGDDTLVPGTGADAVDGGAGADLVSAADGARDTIVCGSGADAVVADLGAGGVTDDVAADCESVTGPTAPPPAQVTTVTVPVPFAVPGPGTPAPAAPVPAPAPAVRDLTPPAAALRLAARGRLATARTRGLSVPVACAEPCGISITVSVDRATARRLRLPVHSGPTIVGTAAARTAIAGTRAVRVPLSRSARRATRRPRRVAIAVEVLVSDAAGNGVLLRRRVTLVR